MFNEQNYNLLASAAISLNRSLPDDRPTDCHNIVYDAKLPDTSVIIIFHNEALPTLLRTIYSIIERSPRSLLKEIILVDDVSDIENYGNVLVKFIELLPVEIKLIRTETRIGLTHARLLGAKQATVNFSFLSFIFLIFSNIFGNFLVFREMYLFSWTHILNAHMVGLNHFYIELQTIAQL